MPLFSLLSPVQKNCFKFGNGHAATSVMRLASRGLAGGVDRENKFPDRFSVEEMPLDDLLEHFRRTGVIPNAVRINHRDRAVRADSQAIDFAALNQRRGS